MTDPKRETIVERINKLLAIAMDPNATEHERDLAQQRADALMFQNTIDEHELVAAQRRSGTSVSEVVSATWRMNFDFEFASHMTYLLNSVAEHTNCRVEARYDYDKETKTNRKVVIVGTASQIAYTERLWLVVYTGLVRSMFPKVDPTQSFDHNVYALVKAGEKWQDIHAQLWAKKDDPRWTEFPLNDPYPDSAKHYSWERRYAGDGGRLKRAYRREAARLGENDAQAHGSRRSAYRLSYVDGYRRTISQRLWEMRRNTAQAAGKEAADKYAVAIRDTQADIDALFYSIFPEYSPEAEAARNALYTKEYNERRAREAAEWDALSDEEKERRMAKKQKQQERAQREYEKMQAKRYDAAGYSRGNNAARKVNLSLSDEIKHSATAIANGPKGIGR